MATINESLNALNDALEMLKANLAAAGVEVTDQDNFTTLSIKAREAGNALELKLETDIFDTATETLEENDIETISQLIDNVLTSGTLDKRLVYLYNEESREGTGSSFTDYHPALGLISYSVDQNDEELGEGVKVVNFRIEATNGFTSDYIEVNGTKDNDEPFECSDSSISVVAMGGEEIPADLKVFYIDDANDSSHPFVFEDHEPGIYFIRFTYNQYSQEYVAMNKNVYFKAFNSESSSKYIQLYYNSPIIYYKNVKEVSDNTFFAGVSYLQYGYSSYPKLLGVEVRFKVSSGVLNISENKTWEKQILDTSTEQVITAKKTFNTLPESSAVPTTNNQLVNKKYVDDNIPSPMQYATMPTADSTTVGKIVQYTGTTDSTYTNGYFYIGTTDGQDPATYSWENLNVQAGGISSAVTVITDNSSSNPFVFEDHKPGLYAFYKSDNKTTSQPIYFKTFNSNTGTTFTNMSYHSILYYFVDVSGNEDYFAYIHFVSVQRDSVSDCHNHFRKDSSKNSGFYINQTSQSSNFVNQSFNQTIYGTKTFSVLPESSVTPTTNNQLTNKSYVDNAISSAVGSINTVLASLTTPSNNGGGE